MCAAYLPPTEDITSFNSALFTHDSGSGLSQGLADILYLNKTRTDISTAPQTTFNGNTFFLKDIEVSNATLPSLNLKVSDTLKSNIRQNNGELQIRNLSTAGGSTKFLFTGSAVFSIQPTLVNTTTGCEFQTRVIRSIDTAAAHTLFDNMTGGSITMGGTTSTNSIRGDTTFPQNVVVSGNTTLGGEINLNATSYSFPFSSNRLGYYFKEAGIGNNSVATTTPKTIFTSSSIPIGVWRIDFSVENYTNTAGTLTNSQSYISTTLNGALATAVPHLGSIIRTSVPKSYGAAEVELLQSSFTYNQTTAGVLYVNVIRVYTTGTYTFTAELSITRLA